MIFAAAQWYNHDPRQGALYLAGWSFHWALDGPVVYRDGKVQTLQERPRRVIHVYRGVVHTFLRVPLWRSRAFCKHGFHRSAWWHACGLVSDENPAGRPPDEDPVDVCGCGELAPYWTGDGWLCSPCYDAREEELHRG